MLLRLRGASAISGEQDYEILAQIGDTDDGILSPSLLSQLDDAKSNKISRLHGDTYVGYFPNSSGKASCWYSKAWKRFPTSTPAAGSVLLRRRPSPSTTSC
jgi:hypothetical protein